MNGFASRDCYEQPPEIIAIRELRIAARLHSATKTFECRERDVLVVGHAAKPGRQLLLGKTDEPLKVVLPKLLRRIWVTVAKLLNPAGDSRISWHWV